MSSGSFAEELIDRGGGITRLTLVTVAGVVAVTSFLFCSFRLFLAASRR
jgi:hypothetical protein